MGIDWMIWGELVEAIPPVYTENIGKQILDVLVSKSWSVLSGHHKIAPLTFRRGFLLYEDKNPYGIGTVEAIASTHTGDFQRSAKSITDYLSVV